MADNAYELQAAKAKQKNVNENMEIEVIDRRERVTLEEQETLHREKQLESTVKQEADAEKYKTETLAAAEKQKTILEAEAEAEAIRLRGEAWTFLVQKRAEAEAYVMNRKAEAWEEYRKAAMLGMYTSTLPELVREVGSNLSKVKSVKMVSTGDSAVGAVKLTNEVIDVASSIPSLVRGMTGIDFLKILKETLTH